MQPLSATTPPAPNQSSGIRTSPRWSLALLLTINMVNYIDRAVLASALPKIKEDLLAGATDIDFKAGLLAPAFLVSYMIASPLFGWLADRMSRWLIVGLGVIAWSLAS